MISITPAAATQIRVSAKQGNMEGMAMRIAARRQSDGSIHYGMGFDGNEQENDVRVHIEGIDIVIAMASQPLVDGMTVDYVEIEPDSFQFIFLNPNDANYVAPKTGA
jgi:iron-sulfur cluster assembly protein